MNKHKKLEESFLTQKINAERNGTALLIKYQTRELICILFSPPSYAVDVECDGAGLSRMDSTNFG